MAGLITRGFAEVLDVQEKLSKKNKPYTIAVLGDKDTYFKGEFFVSSNANIQGVPLNTKVEVILQHEVRGYDIATSIIGFNSLK